jgi:hypothetical protein
MSEDNGCPTVTLILLSGAVLLMILAYVTPNGEAGALWFGLGLYIAPLAFILSIGHLIAKRISRRWKIAVALFLTLMIALYIKPIFNIILGD